MNDKYYRFFKDIIYKHRLLILFGFLNLISQVVSIIYSDIAFLSTKWFVDDSFYYLQTAWNFKSYYQFTFDSLNLSYGFQPLWMIISVLVSFLSPNKIFYFKSILLFSAFVYVLCGFLIHLIFSKISKYKLKYLPSIIWFLNPDLINIFNSGKENILALLLLLLIIYYLFKLKNQNSSFTLAILGILSGLLILTRLNTIIFVVMILSLLYFNKNYLQQRKKILFFIAPLVVTLLPWLAYSYWTFNTVFPTSGTVKLYGVMSSWLIWFSNVFQINDLAWLKTIIPQFEWKLFENRIMISPPLIQDLLKYSVKYLPISVLGFGVYGWAKKSIYPFKYLIEIFYYFILFTPFILVLIKPTKFYFIKEIITSIFNKIKDNPLVILIVYSCVNLGLSFILLSKWILYCNWYSFAEMLSILFLIGIFIDVFIHRIKTLSILYNHKFLAILLVLLTLNFVWQMYPKVYKEDSSHNSQAWEAHDWIVKNLNKNEIIACWSSGILGYWMEDFKVINLDGLINSPKFVKEIIPNFILFQNNITDNNLMWTYIKKNNIKYIAEAWFADDKYKSLFHWTVPEGNYKVIYKGPELIDWKEPWGKRQYFVIELLY